MLWKSGVSVWSSNQQKAPPAPAGFENHPPKALSEMQQVRVLRKSLVCKQNIYNALQDILSEPMLHKAPQESVTEAAAHKTKSLLLLHFILLSC